MTQEKHGTIFVAGASGAIGRRLCPLLVAEGWRVAGSTRSTDKARLLRELGVEPVIVDVFDRDALSGIISGIKPDIIVHELTDLPFALDSTKMAEARIRNARLRETGTANLVSAAIEAGTKKMVAQSIAFAYAPGPRPHSEESPLNLNDADAGLTARAVASLEQQVLGAPFKGVVLRYGKLYGPGTGFDLPASDGPLHVDAAADAARRAVNLDIQGIYNIVEEDGFVSNRKAVAELLWTPNFRVNAKHR